MRYFIGLVMAVVLLAGCSVVRDYQTGANTPLEAGEVSPQAAAQPIVNVVGTVYPPAAGPALMLLTAFATWKRGRRIRKGLPVSAQPITGHWGSQLGLEKVVQTLSSAVAGLFEVGPEGSGLRRGWKVLLATGIASVGLPLALKAPGVAALVASHSEALVGILGLLAAIVAGLEKELSRVLPVQAPAEG